MLKYTWVVIYGIFYTAAAGITFGKLNGKDKSVNLALETVFEFGDEDKKGDVNLLSSVQKFIGKVKNVIENSNGGRRQLSDENKRFTSFVIDVIRILKQYEDQDLEQVAYIVSDGMKKHHRKGSQLHNLTKSLSIHDIVAKKLGEIKKKSAIDIREYLESVAKKIRKDKYLKHEKQLLEAINSVYTADSTIKLNSFLTDLDDYRGKARKNMDLSKIINHGLRSVFFDHFHNLNINKKSLLLSGLNEAFGQLSNNFNKIMTKNIKILYSQPVTKTTKALRTNRQIFVERDLDMKYIKNAFNKWISEEKTKHGRNETRERGKSRGKSLHKTRTPVTQRPHNVPTTRKPSYEYKHDALRSYPNKKHRFLKVSNEQSSPKYKKRKTQTTTQYRTYRQMYVEKNIDLKYNADAYENLTTAKKVRTTRKHVLNTYKDEGDSYERHSDHSDEEETVKPQYVKEHDTDEESEESGQNTKNEKEVEGVLSDLMIELSTEVHVPSITKSPKARVTRMRRFSGETLIDKNIDYAEVPRFRGNSKGFAYSTPGFLIDWSTREPRILERILPQASIENRELKTHRAKEKRKDSKKNKDMDNSNEVKKEKYLERYRKNKQNYRNKADDHPKYYTRDSRVHLGKITKRYHRNVPILRQERESLRGNLKMSRSPLILAKHYGGSHQFGKNYFRRTNSQAPKISEEGLSIQADDDTNKRKSHRRYDNSDTPKIDGDKKVLERLQKLEHELEIVKTQIKNDTSAVKDLIKNSRNDKTNDNKVTQLQKAIIDLNSKPNLDIEAVTQLKSINTGGDNVDIPDTYKRLIYNNKVYDLNKISLDLTKGKEHDSYRIPYENPSTVGTIIQTIINDEQGRKAFPDLKSVVKSDEVKTNETPSNFKAMNNTPIEDIEKMSVTSKTKEAESDNSQTYYKGSLKNKPDPPIYFRVNDDSNENTFNVTAYETLKDKYSSSHLNNEAKQNLNDTKVFNNQATAIDEEVQLNEDSQTKATTTKADLDDHVANITQSNSSKELKHDDNINNNRDISDKNNETRLDFTTKVDEPSKLQDESIIKSDKIITVTSANNFTTAIVPGTITLPGLLMNQPDANADNVVQRSVDKEPTDDNLLPSTLKSDTVKNESLPIQQNVLKPDTDEHPANVSVIF